MNDSDTPFPVSDRSLDSERTMRGEASAPVRRLRPGDVLLGRYTVLSELGEGGMGVVHKCLDLVGGIEVAVKCLPPELSRNAEEMEGIRENYGIVAKLHHSAISGLRQLERDPDTGEYYLVMDLAEGEDLSAILRRRRGAPMPLEEALAILRPLASALDYAHGERVLHRDVKPANVKVRTLAAETQAVEGRKSNVKGRDSNLGPSDIGPSTRLRVQLLDFGLAAEVRSSMSRVSVRGHAGTSGTPAYMAPEQWEARPPDFRTDQYALAVMAYQMLAGFLPFDSEDTDVLRRAVLSRAPDPIPSLPRGANAALLRALSKDPKERFPTCGAFMAALEGRDGSASRPPDGRAAGASLPDGAGINEPKGAAALEADVLRRKVALTRDLAAIPEAIRKDPEFSAFISDAELEMEAAKEALDRNRIAAAAACIDLAAAALMKLGEARKRCEEARQAGERKVVSVDGVKLALRWCPPGSFQMGSPTSEDDRYDDEIQHRVMLSTGFWMGETEVTQGLWKKVVGGNNPSDFQSGDEYPVETVSWKDCQDFLRKFNSQSPVAGFEWRLPTEAQWEYACRAGSSGAFSGTGRLDDMGWHASNSGGKTHPVTQKKANAWGLYDMHGNVWEWCADGYGSYPSGTAIDPAGMASDSYRVYRGGSWRNNARFCRSANRNYSDPGDRFNYLGFRVALVPVR